MKYYTRSQLEEMADDINRNFFPERLEKVTVLDEYALLENLGLEVEWDYISPNEDILGLIFFENGSWYVWDDLDIKKKKVRKKYYQKGTVVINQILLDSETDKNRNRERFVANHESMHWVKDKPFFSTRNNGILQICNEKTTNSTYWSNQMSGEEIVERQTNYLNAAVLMPKDITINTFFKLARFKNIPTEPIDYMSYMTKHVAKLAKMFGLNFRPVLYRLYDLNILKRKDEIK